MRANDLKYDLLKPLEIHTGLLIFFKKNDEVRLKYMHLLGKEDE